MSTFKTIIFILTLFVAIPIAVNELYLKSDIEKYNLEVNSKRLLKMKLTAWFFTSVSPKDIKDRLDAKDTLVLVDIRDNQEFNYGHIPGSINYPINEMLRDSCRALAPYGDSEFVVISSDGTTAKIMAAWMEELNFNLVHWMQGGIENWDYARSEPK